MPDQEHADSIQGAAGHTAPGILIGAQYVRGLSVSVPNTPGVFANLAGQPHMALTLDVNARQLGDNQPNFEVAIIMRAQGLREAPTPDAPPPERIYEVELAYCGVVVLQNAGSEALEPLLLVEAPRMLFPAARNVLAMNIREAGFPVAMIHPVDFVALWHARRAQR